MSYDFDAIIERTNTFSEKWDTTDKTVLPMWVADMDFVSPTPVIEALKNRVEHGVFGYTVLTDAYYDAISNWVFKRHGWRIEKEWIQFSPGVISGICMLLQAMALPGDKVILQMPVYYPFFDTVTNNGCQIVNNPLKQINGKYFIDFNDLEQKAADEKTKFMIFCSPHNPVGRVWTPDETARVADICQRHHVFIASDEIHADLVYKPYKHTPLGLVLDQCLANSAACMSVSKTFNLPGIKTSSMIISDPEIRLRYKKVLHSNGILEQDIFGITATIAAYNEGEEWLEQLQQYLKGNLDYIRDYLNSYLPGITLTEPEGTYLAWLDLRGLPVNPGKLSAFLLHKAKVRMVDGYKFGDGGLGFARLNIACPRSVLAEGLERIKSAVSTLNK